MQKRPTVETFMTENAATIFRDNLRKRAAKHGYHSLNELASALGWSGNQRRYLRRLWEQGITRPDPRMRNEFEELTRFLRIFNRAELWIVTDESDNDPSDFVDPILDSGGFSISSIKTITAIISTYQRLQKAKLQKPIAYQKALKQVNGSEALLVANFLEGSSYQCEFQSVETEDLFTDLNLEIDTEYSPFNMNPTELRSFLDTHLASDRRWKRYLAKLEAKIDKDFERFWEDDSVEKGVNFVLHSIFLSIYFKCPSLSNLLDEFTSNVLANEETELSPFDAAIVTLQSHPNWNKWVDIEFAGSELDCIAKLREMWRIVQRLQKEDSFIDSFVTLGERTLDELCENEVIERNLPELSSVRKGRKR